MKVSKLLKWGVAGYLFLAPFLIFAQVSGLEQSFNLSVSPQNPGPRELVSFSVSAFEFNIDLANIVWSVDGKSVKSGTGEKSFSFTSPENGKSSTVSVVVTPKGGSPIQKSMTISPADMDLIYEVIDGYTPPFYKGKTLPIKQSQLRVVAMPNVKTVSGGYAKAKDFVYTWRKDGENIPSQSGFGRNSLILSNQILDTGNTVEVAATNGIKKVDGSLEIVTLEPEIVFYELSLATGVKYQKAIVSGETISQPKLSLVAEPYFLSKNIQKNNDIVTTWKLNEQPASPVSKNNLIINTAAATGTVNVMFEYNDTRKLFRNFKKSLSLILKN